MIIPTGVSPWSVMRVIEVKISSCSGPCAKPVRPVNSEYPRIVRTRTGLRPYKSANVGKTKIPIRPTHRDTVVIFPIVTGEMPHSFISSGVTSCIIVAS
jgi:hypothetical protein